MIRAVVDPSVLVSAFIGDPKAGPGRLITAWRDRRFVLVVSPLLLDELTDVLGRPKFDRWSSPGRAPAYIAALITGTLDGAAIEISGFTHRMAKGAGSVIVRSDQGTFTAVADADAPAEAHSAALRLYMEHRPSGGWRTEVERSHCEDGEWRFDVLVTNDRVSALVELRMSEAVAKAWTMGAQTPPSDQMVAEHVAVMLRGADWSAVQWRALHPTTVLGGRLRR